MTARSAGAPGGEAATGLFDALVDVAARTLGRSVAPFTLARLLLRARVFDRERLTPAQVRGAWATLETGIGEFLTPEELRATMDGFAAVLAGVDGAAPVR